MKPVTMNLNLILLLLFFKIVIASISDQPFSAQRPKYRKFDQNFNFNLRRDHQNKKKIS